MRKRLVIPVFVASLSCVSLWCQTIPAEDWVLGGCVFSVKGSHLQDTAGLENVSSALPSLILENLADTGVRVLSPEEILERRLVLLYKERGDLGKSLTSAIKERDRQLFVSPSQGSLQRNLKNEEKKVLEIRRQLEEKDAEIAAVKGRLEDRDFQDVGEERETVALWEGSSDKLFAADRKIRGEEVNGLLTGTITASGNYVAVTVHLTLYPGAIHSAEIQSLSSLADIAVMSREIAAQLKPVLQNRETALVSFDIAPAEARDRARIFVDGQAFHADRLAGGQLLLPAGSCVVEVESSGFRTRTFTADFSGGGRFSARVTLEPAEYARVDISSDKFPGAQVYIDGIPEGAMGTEMEVPAGVAFGTVLPAPPPRVPGEGQDALQSPEPSGGEASAAGGAGSIESPYYFVAEIHPESGLQQLNVRLKRDTDEISSRIEKRRRAMYNSYSALLVSLIPSFVTYGIYTNMSNGRALGHESDETVRLWKNIFTGSMVLSAGLGVNLAVQLGLFIGAADSALPERAKAR